MSKVLNFETKGEQAQWRFLYDVVKDSKIGDFFSFSRLESMTGFKKQLIQGFVKKVNLNLENKILVNVRKEGYRIALPNEHEDFARKKEKRAKRSMDYGLHAVMNTNDSDLTIEEQQKKVFRINHIQSSLMSVRKRTIANINERVKVQAKQEKVLNDERTVLSKLEDMMEEIAKLKKEIGK